MRLLRMGQRLGTVGRRIAHACGACCGGGGGAPYAKYVRCGQTNAVYVHDDVICTAGGTVNSNISTFLHAGYCWARSGMNKYTIVQLPGGATVIGSGTVECVPNGCANPVCDDTLYVISWPCKACATFSGPEYFRADLLEGNTARVYGSRCLNGGTIRRGDIPVGQEGQIRNGPLDPTLFRPSCCAACCTPNQPCVPGCCCSNSVWGYKTGQKVIFMEYLYNGGRFYVTSRTTYIYTATMTTITYVDTFLDYTGQNPPTTNTIVQTRGPESVNSCDCPSNFAFYETNGSGYRRFNTTYSLSCGNWTETIDNDAYGTNSGGYSRSRTNSSLSASFSNNCNDCGGPAGVAVAVMSGQPGTDLETAGELL